MKPTGVVLKTGKSKYWVFLALLNIAMVIGILEFALS